jgi:uncharacterized protein YhbP (UPF0306 family)
VAEVPDFRAILEIYLKQHKSMTIATSGGNGLPWAASVFYAHDDKLNFYFLSEGKTRHSRDIAANRHSAVAINDDPADWREIKGVQMEGEAMEVRGAPDKVHGLSVYLAKFPFVRDFIHSPLNALEGLMIAGKAFTASLYVFSPLTMYYLDNKSGFSNRREIKVR